jgi:hypothetical protein
VELSERAHFALFFAKAHPFNNSGSFAALAAFRRASSLASIFAADRGPLFRPVL